MSFDTRKSAFLENLRLKHSLYHACMLFYVKTFELMLHPTQQMPHSLRDDFILMKGGRSFGGICESRKILCLTHICCTIPGNLLRPLGWPWWNLFMIAIILLNDNNHWLWILLLMLKLHAIFLLLVRWGESRLRPYIERIPIMLFSKFSLHPFSYFIDLPLIHVEFLLIFLTIFFIIFNTFSACCMRGEHSPFKLRAKCVFCRYK